ncbi:MAG: N-methyl-L-tryptophan oxidase, partial [Pseudomonadales bacterium]
MGSPTYDCIVVGIGGIGSAALYHLARRGAKVLGIDQYPVAHDQGSSHGDTRAIRLVYFEHPDYVPLLKRSLDLWEELNEKSAHCLFHRTGILQSGPASGEVIKGLTAAAAAHDLPMEQLSASEVSDRFKGFSIPSTESAIFDPNGGVLKVEDCIRAHVHLAETHGAALHTPETVRHWYVDKQAVNVETDKGHHKCKELVITPGPWAPRMLPAFAPHLHLLRKSLFWFDNEEESYHIENGCPVFLFEQGKHAFYGFPALDEKGIKVADHNGGRPITSPADLDRHVDTDELGAVSLMLRQYLPAVGHQLNDHTTCMYTMSADGHFIVGHYPEVEQVNVVAGLSGHGFKFAPVLGEIMADLAL